MQPSVEDLFEQWRSRGDHRALATLFDRTAPELWRVARHLSGRRSEAEDLLQATYLAVMESAGRFRKGQPLVPWMLGILANKLRMAARRQRLRAAVAPTRERTGEDPVAAAVATELRDLLQLHLATLPEAYRAVLVLQFEHGFSAAEVAHTLGRPLATVRSQMYRGLELLRRALPAGLLAMPGTAESPPDLRSVRGAVLLAAGGKATVAGVSLGVTFMMKKLLVGAVVLLVAGVWYGWPRSAETAPGAASLVAATSTTTASDEVVAAVEQPPLPEARTAVAGAPRGPGSLRVRVLWADGATVAAMGVCLQPDAGGTNWFAQRWQSTDARGIAVYQGLVPGKVQVRARHGGAVDVDIAAGATAEVDLTIPQGIDVRGTVVDPEGQLVGGAIVVVGSRPEDMLEATRTDANGTFFLRSLSARNRVAAFAEGFGRSQVVSTSEFPNGSLELRLTGVAGSVAGRVFDAEGRPLAGAWVTHGYTDFEGPGSVHALRVEITDSTGAFHLQGVPLAMPWPLHAGAAGHAAWKGSERVTAGITPFVEIRLQHAVQLRGVVQNQSGAPVRGVVHVIDGNSPGKGIGDQRPHWARPFQVTGTDGVYAFFNLLAGEIVVSAHDNHGSVACHTIHAQPGDDLVWDPVLTKDLAIRGTVLDDGGRPLEGWRVVADAPEGVIAPESVETAADGSFALVGCAEAAYTILCYCRGEGWHQAILERRGVKPGGESLVLRATPAAMPSCRVVGRLAVDQPAGEVHVLLVGERNGLQMKGPLVPGEPFELGLVPPGRYAMQLQLVKPGDWTPFSIVALGTRELQVGQRIDLGEVRAPESGELAITLVDAKGQPVPKASVSLALLDAPMGGTGLAIHDGRGTKALAPGTYLPASGTGGVCIEHPAIVVVRGKRTEVHLQLATAVHRQVRYDLTAVGVPMRAVATWKKAGTPLLRHWFSFWQEHPTTLEHDFTPGSWVLELELGDGRVQQFPFVVTSDDTAPWIEIKVTG